MSYIDLSCHIDEIWYHFVDFSLNIPTIDERYRFGGRKCLFPPERCQDGIFRPERHSHDMSLEGRGVISLNQGDI